MQAPAGCRDNGPEWEPFAALAHPEPFLPVFTPAFFVTAFFVTAAFFGGSLFCWRSSGGNRLFDGFFRLTPASVLMHRNRQPNHKQERLHFAKIKGGRMPPFSFQNKVFRKGQRLAPRCIVRVWSRCLLRRNRTCKEQRLPVSATPALTPRLTHDVEGNRITRLQTSLNAADVFRTVDRLPVQLDDHIALREPNIVGERTRFGRTRS